MESVPKIHRKVLTPVLIASEIESLADVIN